VLISMPQPEFLRPWRFFFMVAIGVFLSTMDSSMVNVALPGMMRHFDTTLAQTEWVALIYLLTITTTLLVWGRLSDRFGKGRMYLLGMLVFTVGSVACYLTTTLSALVFCRFVQACGASMMMSSGPAIIKTVFPVHQLGRALGLIGVATSIGLMSGPVISGFLIRYFSWRAIFLVTVPVSLTCFGLGWFLLLSDLPATASKCARKSCFDWAGLLIWTVLITMAVLAASHHAALSGWMVAGFGVSFCSLLLLFKWVEERAVEPLLPLAMFRDRQYAIAMTSAALSFLVLFVVLILTPFYLDYVLRLAVDRIGLMMTAVPLAVCVVSPLSGRLYDRMGARILTTSGLALCCFSILALSFLDQQSELIDIAWRLSLLGAGQALFLSPNSASVLAKVDPHRIGVTSGMLATARNMGMLAGVALAGLIFGKMFFWLSGGLDVKEFSVEHSAAFIQSLRMSFALTALLAFIGALLSSRRA
jgi:EmrB/QacA subfamily drug resistance transporter